MKRVATAQSRQGAEGAFPGAVLQDGQPRVLGAGWRKAAGRRQEGGEPAFVERQQGQEDVAQAARDGGRLLSIRSRSLSNAANVAFAAAGFRCTTRSIAGRSFRPFQRRKVSRERRFTRCRITELPTFRLAVMPSRG